MSARARRRVLALAALAALASCHHEPSLEGPLLPPGGAVSGTGGAEDPPEEAPHFLVRIPDEAAWSVLAARPNDIPTARTEVVKVVIDLRDHEQVYFLQSRRWDLHYDFVRAFLDPLLDHGTYNAREYRSDARRYVNASLVHYIDGDQWAFELVAGDILDAPRLLAAFENVRRRVHFGDRLRFHPVSELHESRVAELGDRIPVIATNEVLAHVQYQPVVAGTAYGHLRLVREPLDPSTVRPNEILVLADVPIELPPVAGVVTARLQAPLCHVAVLSQNRGTPDMALRGAVDDARFASLEGQLVRLVVGPQEFAIGPADLADAEASWTRMRPTRAFAPVLEPDEARLRSLCELTTADVSTVGAKAAQLGELCGLTDDLVTPGGFAVPFHHYLAHLAPMWAEIEAMLADETFRARPEVRAGRLEALRQRIEAAPVDRRLLREMRAQIGARQGTRLILRSSTNAEDLVGFNGAGLYRSVVVSRDATDAELADALRQVWSSVWLTRAFEERDWYRIDHLRVAMGVLVQPFVGDLAANGVAITRNPFHEMRPGVFVNVQTQEGSVTGAGGDEVPEQVLVYTWTPQREAEVVSRSSLNGGVPILRESELARLADLLVAIHDHMVPRYGGRANAVDVEFLLTRDDRRFVIVQARPYQVSYAASGT